MHVPLAQSLYHVAQSESDLLTPGHVWHDKWTALQGYLADRKQPLPLGSPYDSRIVRLQSPRREALLMSEVEGFHAQKKRPSP